MSGNKVSGEKLDKVKTEFEKIRKVCHQKGQTVFE
jgi:hypothetical protein